MIMSIFNISRYKKRVKAFLVTTLLLGAGVAQAQIVIEGNVYGGGKLGIITDNTSVTINEGTTKGNVFGGGMGADTSKVAGLVQGNVTIDMNDGSVEGNIYGGGELACVGEVQNDGTLLKGKTNINMIGGTVGKAEDFPNPSVTELDEDPDRGHIYGGGKGDGDSESLKTFCNVNYATVNLIGGTVQGSVYGGSAFGHVLGNDSVFITGTTVGTNGLTGYDGSVFGGGKGSGYFIVEGNDTTAFAMYKTCGRVAGNNYVKMNSGIVKACLYGGGRLALTGVDEDGNPSFRDPADATKYDSINHGLALVDVRGTSKIGITDTYALLNCDYSVGDIFGGGQGDLDYYDVPEAGCVANAIVNVAGEATIYCTVFGGGEIAGVGYMDSNRKFLKGTGATRDTIAGTATIGSEYEFLDHDYQLAPTEWTMFDTVNNVRRLQHTCSGNVFGASQGDAAPDSPKWIYLGHSRTAEVVVKDSPIIRSCVFGGAEQGTVTENTYVKIMGGTIGTTGITSDSLVFEGGNWTIKPNHSLYNYGSVYGGGFGVDSLQYGANVNDSLMFPNFLAGRVYGNTYVNVSAGTIRGNVYGGGNMASVGVQKSDGTRAKGRCFVTVGGTATIGDLDGTGMNANVFGGGRGFPGDSLKAKPRNPYANVNSTEVTIAGGSIKGSVYGGGAYSHVLDSTDVIVRSGTIGTDGFGRYDGSVFGGGRGHLDNFTAGRVAGNTQVVMEDGNVLGNIYGGGLVALTGVDVDGKFSFKVGSEYDSLNHGLTKVEVSGGTIGNNRNNGYDLLRSNYEIGNVYGGGRGNIDEYIEDDYGRAANAVVKITGSPTIYNCVYGGGQMANIGHWNNYESWYTTGTGATRVTIQGSPSIGMEAEFIDNTYLHNPGNFTYFDTIRFVNYNALPEYDTTYLRMLSHTRTGNVYGGGQGDVKIDKDGYAVGLEQGHCRATYVHISETPTIMSSVYGGSVEGAVWGETEVHIAGGTIGRDDIIPDSLKFENGSWSTLSNTAPYNYGDVFGGSYGKDYYTHLVANNHVTQQAIDSVNGLAGRVYGNTLVDITNGTIRGNVYGGGDLASVGQWTKTLENPSDPTSALIDIVPIADPVKTELRGNATVNVSGGTIGPLDGTGLNAYVFGGGKGFHMDPNELRKTYANVDSTFVTISGGNVYGSIFGGGNDSHVLGSVSIEVQDGANIGTDGLSTWDGNIFGGGRNFLNTNHTNGRVRGNIGITMNGGTIQGSIFGGGRLALSGINVNGEFPESNWDPTKYGNVNIQVSGTASGSNPVTYSTVIGNSNGRELLTGSDESVGDIFGSGKGDTKAYEDVQAGCVTNTAITITGSPRIYGGVFGGGEMASIGYLNSSNGFVSGTGESTVVVGSTNASESKDLIIGTYLEYDTIYMKHDPGDWTIYDSIGDAIRVVHTCAGNVYGGCQGDVDPESPNWILMAHSRTASVTINSGNILSSVFGGPEQGTMKGDATVIINGGTIGQKDLVASDSTHYSFGSVYGGGYGSDKLNKHWNAMCTVAGSDTTFVIAADIAGRVYGNTTVEINGGTIREHVFGGGEMASVTDSCKVIVNNVTMVGPLDRLDTDSLNMVGDVYGAGKGIPSDLYKKYCNVNNTKVIIGDAVSGHIAKIAGDVYGGGADCHVLGNTNVYIHEGAFIGTRGVTNYDGNVFGGGRGSGEGEDETFAINKTCGRVEGNTNVTMDGGTLKSSIFGGGRLALTGVDEDGEYNNYTSKGKATINVSGGTIGTTQVDSLLRCDNSVGDIFGSGKGDITYYNDIIAGCVTNTEINITGSPVIKGSVFGGGEMAGIGYRNNTGVFIDGTGEAKIKIGESATDNPTIGTEAEFMFTKTENPGEWTIYDDVTGKILHTCTGNVFGGSQGDVDTTATAWVSMASSRTATVTINRGTIRGKVYGGSEQGTVVGNTLVTVNGGTIGTLINQGSGAITPYYLGEVYGAGYGSDDDSENNSMAVNDSTAARTALGLPWTPAVMAGRVYGKSQVDFKGGYVKGSVYGGGERAYIGYESTSKSAATGKSEANVDFTYSANTNEIVGNVFGANNVTGSPFENAKATVIKGTVHNVFGGGNVADCLGTADVIINGGISDTVFGGGNLAATHGSTVTMNDGSVLKGVYGGCNANDSVKGNINVIILGGTIGTSSDLANVHGGGYGQNTGSKGNVTVTFGDDSGTNPTASTNPTLYGNVYGGSAFGTVNDEGTDKTTVNIRNGALRYLVSGTDTIGGSVYGGGLGLTGPANINKGKVYGAVTVNVGDSIHQAGVEVADTTICFGYATIGRNVYGCNDSGGSPQEDVTVNIFGTAHTSGAEGDSVTGTKFAIANVFGGGNFANYDPKDGGGNSVMKTATVNIFGCDNTVWRVFGGGDASSSPNVTTDIQGGRFAQVFGGGNGERGSEYAANITGNVVLGIHGGQVGMSFGGSNQNGLISGTTTIVLDNDGPCGETDIDEYFCGGNYVDVVGDVDATITCSQGMHVKRLYGGCNQAHIKKKLDGTGGNVNLTVLGGEYECVFGGSKGRPVGHPEGEFDAYIEGNVNLTIKGGTIDTVFGGSNIKGNVYGKIIVNIDDAGSTDCPLEIHNVYGGGHDAPYTPTTSGCYPEVNVLNGTISKSSGLGGNVFGGGFGSDAVVNNTSTYGPKVTIGGRNSVDEATVEGNVYGGGHGANVVGNPHVILDGASKVNVEGDVFGGGKEAIVTGNAKVEVR